MLRCSRIINSKLIYISLDDMLWAKYCRDTFLWSFEVYLPTEKYVLFLLPTHFCPFGAVSIQSHQNCRARFFFSKINHLNEIFFKILRYIQIPSKKETKKKGTPMPRCSWHNFFGKTANLRNEINLLISPRKWQNR